MGVSELTEEQFFNPDYSIIGFIHFKTVTSFKARQTNKDLSVLMEHFRPFRLENYNGLLLLCKMESENSKLTALHLLMPYKKEEQW